MADHSPPPNTQYDLIGLSYESMKQLPAARLERANLRATLEPLLTKTHHSSNTGSHGATVLDLACGTGYYSRLLMEWGAARVVGVDISPKMVEVAREQSRSISKSLSLPLPRLPESTSTSTSSSTSTSTSPQTQTQTQTQTEKTSSSGTESDLYPSPSGSQVYPPLSWSLSFHVGDCTQPLELQLPLPLPRESGINAKPLGESDPELGLASESEQFDIVLGAWLLNYAGTSGEMTNMFTNIVKYLNPGGHFVGITPYPAADLDAFAAMFGYETADTQSTRKPSEAKYGVTVTYKTRLQSGEGYATRVTAHVSPVEIAFDNYHLRREVYERSARQAGLTGSLEWRGVRLPSPQESVGKYGVSPDFWDGYLEAPHFGILVIEKEI